LGSESADSINSISSSKDNEESPKVEYDEEKGKSLISAALGDLGLAMNLNANFNKIDSYLDDPEGEMDYYDREGESQNYSNDDHSQSKS